MNDSPGKARSLLPHVQLPRVQFESLYAGVCGGAISTAIVHPLDLIKIRLQVNDGTSCRPPYKGMFDCGVQIFKSQGVRGLYQGLSANVWGAAVGWGSFFFFYNNIKTHMQGGDSSINLGPARNLLAATQSGLITLFFIHPLGMLKTRMCLQYDLMSVKLSMPNVEPTATLRYSGMSGALLSIWRHEGMRGFYKGLSPAVLGVSDSAVQIMTYEELKRYYTTHYSITKTKLAPVECITLAAISKMFSVSLTYPYQVVRSRLQEQHRQYNGVFGVITETWRTESWRGFYKGMGANLARVTPVVSLTYVIYEAMLAYLKPSTE